MVTYMIAEGIYLRAKIRIAVNNIDSTKQ